MPNNTTGIEPRPEWEESPIKDMREYMKFFNIGYNNGLHHKYDSTPKRTPDAKMGYRDGYASSVLRFVPLPPNAFAFINGNMRQK
jgi:hypothetical protein